jgi:hypothetical protein
MTSIKGINFGRGFIHILNEYAVFSKDTVNAILAYHATEYDDFVKSAITTGKILYLNVHVLESPGQEMKYEIKGYESSGKEDWIDISNKRSIQFVVTLRNILLGITLILCVVKLFWLLKLVIFKQT